MINKRYIFVQIGLMIFLLSGNENNVLASNSKLEFDDSKRKIPQTFYYKYNYDELFNFLKINKEEFQSEWKSGKTIEEIAEDNGIPSAHLIVFLAEKRFNALNKSLKDREIDNYFYYDYAVFQLKEDILEFIRNNLNKYNSEES